VVRDPQWRLTPASTRRLCAIVPPLLAQLGQPRGSSHPCPALDTQGTMMSAYRHGCRAPPPAWGTKQRLPGELHVIPTSKREACLTSPGQAQGKREPRIHITQGPALEQDRRGI
jgi:hypothetical protein